MENYTQTTELYQLFLSNPSIVTDTRKLKKGDIFFALSGPNFNGNLFAKNALELGASFSIIDQDIEEGNSRLIRVNNVLQSLQDLARYHRQQLQIPVIAITGSNGKTTTKELINAVLSSHYTTYTTQGNLNNHIGVPLTLLSIRNDAEFAVIEMGANHQKEIASYCENAMPDYGLITNCGKAHLDGFGGVEGVRKGKGELFDYLKNNNGKAFVFSDLDYLLEMSQGIKEVISYGTKQGSVVGNLSSNDPFLAVSFENNQDINPITTQLVGDYNLPNVLCSVAIGKYFHVPDLKIKKAIETYYPSNSRSQLILKNTNSIILDAYNANPTSMKAAIQNFASIIAENKILLIGGMMELGVDSLNEHQQLIDFISNYSWEKVVLVGGDFAFVKHPFLFFKTSIEAREWYLAQNFSHRHVLIKGSRSMKMEVILD